MADRVAVFSHGRVEQLDTPRELYNRPRTAFVANFVGSANVVAAELAQVLTGRGQPFAIRPELIDIVAPGERLADGAISCEGTLLDVLYHGASSRCHVQIGPDLVLAVARPETVSGDPTLGKGARVRLAWRPESAVPLEST
jgi:putative spermidine/putrescine transport system ATP-binding protein